MKNLQLQICLLIWFEAVNGLKSVNVELGQNILVNCDLPGFTPGTEVYWYMQTECRAPVLILRTFTAGTQILPKYYSPAFKPKFSLVNHSLLIHNITEEELGNYYCVKTGEPVFRNGTRIFSNGTRIHTTRPTVGQQLQTHNTMWLILSIVSALLNCVFIAAIIALLVSHRQRSSGRQQPSDSDLQHHQDPNIIQYEEIWRPKSARETTDQVDSTYALVQLPKPVKTCRGSFTCS